MLTEMLGKGGRVCGPAREGKLRCPLFIRPTSEDVVTGEIFQVLRAVNPRWWIPQILNEALGSPRFRQQVFRKLRIELWRNRPQYPRELLPWNEGSTQVDVTITWENPPTTIYIESKYGSQVSPKTANDDGSHGFPSDQIIRNVRVGLFECGWFRTHGLFEVPCRDFAFILLEPATGHPQIKRYRVSTRLQAAVPRSNLLAGLPRWPFVGEIGYRQLVQVLRLQLRWLSRPERILVADLCDYVVFKMAAARREMHEEQLGMGFDEQPNGRKIASEEGT